MPSARFFGRRPDPPPAKVNAVTLFVTGTAVWVLATAVIGFLTVRGTVPDRWLDICFAGLGMGVLAVAWGYVHEYRARHRTDRTTGRTTDRPAGRPTRR